MVAATPGNRPAAATVVVAGGHRRDHPARTGVERGGAMPRYLFVGNYSPQGSKGVLAAGGTARRAAIENMVSDLGGRVETFDFAFGSDDVYTIVELPDARTATAIALTVNGSGAINLRTVVLMTPEEVDAAGQVQPNYQPPTS
jgi:uncharacterized protein with GYD domain